MSDRTLSIRLNGENERIPAGSTVLALIEQKGLATKRVAVELNLNVVPKKDFATTVLAEGDIVEVVSFVGGG